MTTKPVTAEDYPALIRNAGWEPEKSPRVVYRDWIYRATQGPFSTPWTATWQEVLDYIKGRKEK